MQIAEAKSRAAAGTLQHLTQRLATKEEAKKLDHEATQIINAMKRSWLSLGLILKEMIETRAFEQLGFRSMRAWMESRLGEQMASAYQSLRAVRALEGVPESKLEKDGGLLRRESQSGCLEICELTVPKSYSVSLAVG